MKLKAIIAAAMTLALTAGAFSTTASASRAGYFIGTVVGHSATSTGTLDINKPGIYKDYDALEGETVTITATPGPGSMLYSFEIPTFGYSVYPKTTEPFSYTFDMPASDVVIIVDFWLDPKTPTTPTEPTTPTTPTEPTTPTTPTEPTTPTTPTEPTTPTTPTEPTTPTTPTEPDTPTTPTEPIAPQYKKGDVNGDGIVSAKDATLILKHAVELITLDSEQLDRADVNGDGRVNAADATLILKMAVGLA